MNFNYFFKCRGIVSTVITGVRSLPALLSLVGGNVLMLEPLPTLIHAFYLHKLTPNHLTLWRWCFIRVLFIFPKFPPPLTPYLFVLNYTTHLNLSDIFPKRALEKKKNLVRCRVDRALYLSSRVPFTRDKTCVCSSQ